MRIAGLSGAAALIMLGVLAIGALLVLNQNTSIAFADVLQNVRKAKSVILTSKQKFGDAPEFVFTWYIQDQHIRMEIPGQMAMIADLQRKKGIQLDFVRKIAKPHPINPATAKGFMNPLEQLRRLKSKDAKRIGKGTLEGKSVEIYEMESIDLFAMKGRGKMTLWVDPKAKLPVKILIQVNTEKGAKGPQFDSRFTFENFSWHPSIDRSLFSLEPPKGFTVKK